MLRYRKIRRQTFCKRGKFRIIGIACHDIYGSRQTKLKSLCLAREWERWPGSAELTRLGQCGGTVCFEENAFVEVAILIK